MRQVPALEETAQEDDVPDLPGHPRLPRKLRQDPHRQGRHRHLDVGP